MANLCKDLIFILILFLVLPQLFYYLFLFFITVGAF